MSASTSQSVRILVIGAGFAGLLTAAAAAQTGARVTIFERDRLGDTPDPRPGVPQGQQPHILLHRGLRAMESLLPGVEDDLLDVGGVKINTGRMPWLSPYGWFPVDPPAYEIVSLTRPLLELVIRRRVLGDVRIDLRQGARVQSLARAEQRWEIQCADGTAAFADLVVDASGRSSRLRHWLDELGVAVPEPATVDARLGYAARRFRAPVPVPLRSGVVIAASPATEAGALVLPVENEEWLVGAVGYGSRRPPRDAAELATYVRELRDPAVAELAAVLEPVGDVAVHRQTGNRRHAYGHTRGWPAGLLVVGDALCAFNPVYGQGITVAACQAELLRDQLRQRLSLGMPLSAADTRRIQRRLHDVTDLPWAVATGEDLRYRSSDAKPNRRQRLSARWTTRMTQLAVGGDPACRDAFSRLYHLMATTRVLIGPGVVRAMARSVVRGLPPPAPRPAVLDWLPARETDRTADP
jgi:2-polyprenyl-6-methoxyphenol hydroxylase-like FAD-dependent oxidoreductase